MIIIIEFIVYLLNNPNEFNKIAEGKTNMVISNFIIVCAEAKSINIIVNREIL